MRDESAGSSRSSHGGSRNAGRGTGRRDSLSCSGCLRSGLGRSGFEKTHERENPVARGRPFAVRIVSSVGAPGAATGECVRRRQRRTSRPRSESPGGAGRLRIIGGNWRGRKLDVAGVAGLRPTADRLRETLFNWLMADVAGARCLDLFAGTGALGFEALSRGAAHCDFIEVQIQAVAQLRQSAEALKAEERARIVNGSWDGFLETGAGPYDIVFLDPPFDDNLLDEVIDQVLTRDCLGASALLYLEYALERPPHPREELEPWKEVRIGAVGACLWRVSD
ncbi:MAG: 16S rRNA (guanine(966)-N(2))-methyltransferase RsmD [Pseudomonadota bacterium]